MIATTGAAGTAIKIAVTSTGRATPTATIAAAVAIMVGTAGDAAKVGRAIFSARPKVWLMRQIERISPKAGN